MPKTTSKRGASTALSNGTQNAEDSDSSDEMTQSRSQLTLTQAEKALGSMSGVEVEQLVNDLVIYLLIADQKKIPIKRQDINKNVLKDNKKAFAGIMSKAKAKLETVFGIKLVDLEQNRYILVNNLDNPVAEDVDPEDHAKTGLVLVILALIFMRGNQIGEDELYEALRKLGVDVDQLHEVFGDVRRLITVEFVRQAYLESERQQTVDPPKLIFRWGLRAKAETTKRDVLEFVCSIYGNKEPTEWRTQWRDIVGAEQSQS